MINDSGLQILGMLLVVVLEGLVVFWLTTGHHSDRYNRMVKQYTYSLDTLSASNTKLRDDNGELEKEVKRLITDLSELRAKVEPEAVN